MGFDLLINVDKPDTYTPAFKSWVSRPVTICDCVSQESDTTGSYILMNISLKNAK